MPFVYIRVKLHPFPRRMEYDKTFARHSDAHETVLVFLKIILIYSEEPYTHIRHICHLS